MNRMGFPFLLAAGAMLFVAACTRIPEGDGSRIRVKVELFRDPGCSECEWVDREFLPALQRQYEGFYELIDRDTNRPGNYMALEEYRKRAGTNNWGSVCMVVEGRVLLDGIDSIYRDWVTVMDSAIECRLAAKWKE